jgi:hypothetical protein
LLSVTKFVESPWNFAYLPNMSRLLAIVFVLILQQPIDATALTFTLEKDIIIVRVSRWKLKTNKTVETNKG